MANAQDLAAMELLTPGSVWKREDNNRVSTFLFLTNQNLPPSLLKDNPQMVIYADDRGNIYSVTVKKFLSKRVFHNVNPVIEQRLESLFAEEDEEAADEEQLASVLNEDDEIILASEDSEESEDEDGVVVSSESLEESEQEVEAGEAINVEFHSNLENAIVTPGDLSGSDLEHRLVSYEQEPAQNIVADSDGKQTIQMTFHKFLFDIEGTTLSAVNSAFAPSEDTPFFSSFTIEGNFVDWDMYLGTYPVLTRGRRFAKVIVAVSEEMVSMDTVINTHSNVEAQEAEEYVNEEAGSASSVEIVEESKTVEDNDEQAKADQAAKEQEATVIANEASVESQSTTLKVTGQN